MEGLLSQHGDVIVIRGWGGVGDVHGGTTNNINHFIVLLLIIDY